MVKHYTNFNIQKIHRGSIILIGNFDGLHLGHQKLFKLAKSYKKKYKLKIGVVNFDPMPKMFFNKSLKNFRITSISQKVNLLSKLKVDYLTVLMNLKVINKNENQNDLDKKTNIANDPKCLLILKKNSKISRNDRCEATGKKYKNCCGAL